MDQTRKITTIRLKVALLNFLLVAALGALLRYYLVDPIAGVNYRYLIHTHSHLAFLGWVFMALFALLAAAFLPAHLVTSRKYSNLFWLLQAANVGMLFTFPFTGYALWSIIFSSVHAIGSIVFAIILIKDCNPEIKRRFPDTWLFIKWSLILMIISNFGPFALGPVMAKGLGYSNIYYLVIYFYLHFQYNGWFTFAVLGLLLWWFNKNEVRPQPAKIRLIFYFNLVAVFPAYILSTLWLKPEAYWYMIGAWSGFLQLTANLVLIGMIWQQRRVFSKRNIVLTVILTVALISFTLKNTLQMLSGWPEMAEVAFQDRNTIIAYLHLVLIGFVSMAIFFLLKGDDFFKQGHAFQLGIVLFTGGFLVSETILVWPVYNQQSLFWLFIMALVQLAGITVLFLQLKRPGSFGPDPFK